MGQLKNRPILQRKLERSMVIKMKILYENMPAITDEEIESALCFSKEQVVRNLPDFTDKFQKAYSEGNFYQPIENNYWTTGFWTGEIWLAN